MSEQLTWSAAVATILIIWNRGKAIAGWIGAKVMKLKPVIQPLIEAVEKAAQDGQITKEERKDIAMLAIDSMEKQGIIKLNFLTRWIVGYVIDKLAAKLPKFEVSKEAATVVKDVIAEYKKGGII
ncbi:MAG: hypothetical protein PHQ22_10495 [Sulfuricurvum sp.]|jgi:hypothetical protein|nr:hypothetical protein [Sulfuricurvum sp.]